MGRLTAHILALALIAALLPRTGHAGMASRPDDLTVAFATCAGRLAAFRNEGWTVPGQRLDSRAAYQGFTDLLAAVGPSPSDSSPAAVTLRAIRAQARTETARLLSIARYGSDARRTRLAAATLAQRLLACESLLP
ncbi:hypothetical protein [Thetidibacter halocola]|uniref:Uncharacterized protein n=1 Tax=Thetidibacter halocola TaxID=2827239 RepID=A0A8J7WDF4_9RHOB|nr:hypothetical protein [Thetidibacter halocola]MBS0123174.1 hypothetical protein [Thetidibacter halocola]